MNRIVILGLVLSIVLAGEIYTEKELVKYNGQNGNPSYVAVDGIVYDVTNVQAWKGGGHKGYLAGQDITSFITKISPHGKKVLAKLTEVGKLVPAMSTKKASRIKGYVVYGGMVYDTTGTSYKSDNLNEGIVQNLPLKAKIVE